MSWVEGPVLTSQMVGTWLRLSACGKSGVSTMSERESTDEEKREALDRSSRYGASWKAGWVRGSRRPPCLDRCAQWALAIRERPTLHGDGP